ncbi:MAG TPA: SDR family oxidoreductase [Ktedonobacterales bacterium]|nr:SDR family oxidoreductase [Ktedonobacterales bacterium]
MILILGTSGHMAGIVARRLLAEGKPVRVLSRAPEKQSELKSLGAEVVVGDLRDPDSLARACKGATAIVNAATGFASQGANTARAVDLEGNLALIEAARAAGVGHVVQISIVGARADHPVDLWRYKYQTEQRLKASGLSHTILRPTAFMELWMTIIAEPITQDKPAMIFGRGVNPINFISVEDVASFVMIALEDPAARGQTITIGGPENLSMTQVAETVGRVTGRPVTMRHIPLPMMRLMGALAGPFNEMFARQSRAGVVMDTADMTFDPSETLTRFPMTLTRLEQAARRRYASD